MLYSLFFSFCIFMYFYFVNYVSGSNCVRRSAIMFCFKKVSFTYRQNLSYQLLQLTNFWKSFLFCQNRNKSLLFSTMKMYLVQLFSLLTWTQDFRNQLWYLFQTNKNCLICLFGYHQATSSKDICRSSIMLIDYLLVT